MNGTSRQRMKTRIATALVSIGLLFGATSSATAQEQTIHERMFHSRAVEAVVWAMPLLNFTTHLLRSHPTPRTAKE